MIRVGVQLAIKYREVNTFCIYGSLTVTNIPSVWVTSKASHLMHLSIELYIYSSMHLSNEIIALLQVAQASQSI